MMPVRYMVSQEQSKCKSEKSGMAVLETSSSLTRQEAGMLVSDPIFSQEQILYKSEKTGGAYSPGPLLRRADWLLKSRSCFCLLFDECVISTEVWRRVAPMESTTGTIIHLTGEAVKPVNRKCECGAQAVVGSHRFLGRKPTSSPLPPCVSPTARVEQCPAEWFSQKSTAVPM